MMLALYIIAYQGQSWSPIEETVCDFQLERRSQNLPQVSVLKCG